MEILAKVPDLSDAVKQALKNTKSAPQPASKSKETKGRETLTINGRALDCEWYQTEDEDGSLSKFWFCNDVPGRTVKVVAKSQGGTQTTVLVEWKGAKK
jgi:hypothetical protein